jgi:phosphohistidine phosphatase SixA
VTRWTELLVLAERERTLAVEGRWEELAEATQERARRAMALPAPPAEARPVLEQLAVLQDELQALLLAGREATLRELTELRRGQTAVRGYAVPATASAAGGWFDGAG